MVWRAAALAVVLGTAPTARADSHDGYFARLAEAVRTGLDQAVAARAPKLVPPVPVAVKWKATRVAAQDLGAPLVAMAAGDLDGDGKGELYAVTSREVIAFSLEPKKLRELGRVAFVGEVAVPASRDVVGTAVIEGGELVAATSDWATELRVSWQPAAQGGAKVLVARAGGAGFLVCPGERAALVPGRNHFGDPAAPLYAVHCRGDLVSSDGHPLRVRGTLVGGKLEVTVEACSPGGTGCRVVRKHELATYGFAFALADVDRDGTPEVIVTGAGAPGDRDAIKVVELGGDEKKGLFRQAFNGGVAAIAVIDSDGDGAQEIVAGVRLHGARVVDVWRFN